MNNQFIKSCLTILSMVIIIIFFNHQLYAQEKIDKIPQVKNGLKTLQENIVYPESAKENGIEGKVFIKAFIDENGNVIKTEVLESASPDLDKAALDAVKKTKFFPGVKDGKEVTTEVTIPIQFKLDDCKEKKNGAEKKS